MLDIPQLPFSNSTENHTKKEWNENAPNKKKCNKLKKDKSDNNTKNHTKKEWNENAPNEKKCNKFTKDKSDNRKYDSRAWKTVDLVFFDGGLGRSLQGHNQASDIKAVTVLLGL